MLMLYSLAVHSLGAALRCGPGPVDFVVWRGVRGPLHAVGTPGDMMDIAHRPAAQATGRCSCENAASQCCTRVAFKQAAA